MKFLKLILPITLLTLVPTNTACMLASARRFAVAYAPTFARTAATRAVVPVGRELMQTERLTIIDAHAVDVTPITDPKISRLKEEVSKTGAEQDELCQKVSKRLGVDCVKNNATFNELIYGHLTGDFKAEAGFSGFLTTLAGLLTTVSAAPVLMITEEPCTALGFLGLAGLFGRMTYDCGRECFGYMRENYWGKKLTRATNAHEQAKAALNRKLFQ